MRAPMPFTDIGHTVRGCHSQQEQLSTQQRGQRSSEHGTAEKTTETQTGRERHSGVPTHAIPHVATTAAPP